MTGNFLFQKIIPYSWKNLEPEEWEPTATILAGKHSQHALQVLQIQISYQEAIFRVVES